MERPPLPQLPVAGELTGSRFMDETEVTLLHHIGAYLNSRTDPTSAAVTAELGEMILAALYDDPSLDYAKRCIDRLEQLRR